MARPQVVSLGALQPVDTSPADQTVDVSQLTAAPMNAAWVNGRPVSVDTSTPAVGRFVGGLARTALPSTTLSDYWQGPLYSLEHPLDAASLLGHAIGSATAAQGRQALADWRALPQAPSLLTGAEDAGDALLRTAATAVPMVGPAVASAVDRMRAGDVAGGMGELTGLVGPGLLLDKLPGVLPDAIKAPIAGAADAAATDRMADVLAPPVGKMKTELGVQAAKVAPQLVREPGLGAWTSGGLLTKLNAAVDQARAGLDAASDARNNLDAYDTSPLVQQLQAARQQLVAEPVEGSRMVPEFVGPGAHAALPEPDLPIKVGRQYRDPATGQILPTAQALQQIADAQAARDAVQQHGFPASAYRDTSGRFSGLPAREGRPIGAPVLPAENVPAYRAYTRMIGEVKQLGPVARYEALRRLRQAWDQSALQQYVPKTVDQFTAKRAEGLAAAKSAGTLRDFLASKDPTTAAANARFHLMLTARNVLQSAAEVARVRPKVGRRIFAAFLGEQAGAAAGHPVAGAVLGPIIDAVASSGPTTQIMGARLLARLADAIRRGDTGGVDAVMTQLKALPRKSETLLFQQGGDLALPPAPSLAPAAAEQQTPAPARTGDILLPAEGAPSASAVNAPRAMPPGAAAFLADHPPGHYTLSDGSTWLKQPDGTVIAGQ